MWNLGKDCWLPIQSTPFLINPMPIFIQCPWGTGKAQLSILSDQISRSVMSDSLRPHESQHARPPCPSPIPGVHPDSRPSSQWCHPAISSSVVPFSSCPQSLPTSESFPMSQLFAWGGQSTGISALASFLPKKSQGMYMCCVCIYTHAYILYVHVIAHIYVCCVYIHVYIYTVFICVYMITYM